MKLSVWLMVALLGVSAAGCSTYINGTAPTKTPDSVYAVGAKAGFFNVSSTVWVCPSTPSKSTDCKPVEVVMQ